MTRSLRRGFSVLFLAGASATAALAGPAEIERGRRLFEGELPLAGRVIGHTADLPTAASRCANCHVAGTAPPTNRPASAPGPTAPPSQPGAAAASSTRGLTTTGGAAAGGAVAAVAGGSPATAGGGTALPADTRSFGPLLSADLLTRDMPRRGGPPSRYDEAALCKLLTTGIDPAYIIIPRSMPRYSATAADCSALWAYLSQLQR